MFDIFLQSPAFGLLLSVFSFQLGLWIFAKTRLPIFNPLLVSMLICIAVLLIFNIPLEQYMKGGSIIHFLLGPATVALAIPLYKHMSYIRKFFIPILIGVLSGVLVSLLLVVGLGWWFGVDSSVLHSLVPKSITTPMGVALSEILGGIPSLTVVAIVITGIVGAVTAPFVLKWLKIKSKIAKGIGIGTAAHALGTTKAMEMGSVEGAMSSAAIGIAGVITVILAPVLISLLEKLFF